MSDLAFYQLRVTEVSPLTDDSVAVTFDVPKELEDRFDYLPGQHMTVRREIDGEDVRRSYSICAPAGSGKLRVGVKRLPGGAFSTYACSDLVAGDVLDVMSPVGDFTIDIDPTRPRKAVAIVAGSGITPVLSLISTSLEKEPESTWTLIYGNKTANSVMFLDELEGLKDRFHPRFQLFHILSREGSDIPLLSGRIDAAKITTIHDHLLGSSPVDGWYLCGPYELVTMARETLAGLGIAADRIHDELFFAGPVDPSTLPPEPPPGEGSVDLTVILDGRAVETRMTPETSILDAALRVRTELPFSCKGGMCATCKGRIEEGEVTMTKNYALIDDEVEAGYVLTCQAHPTTDRVVVRFDHR
ncbi:MAG TPA: 1,2-phenylacetyl-CoA epoxidase subunit PaaE [Acidimicrobiia bacterium]|nr:1,2-phenylacetyl-CoA epoxidase subunit PaaE [Acidimicrobiia bacterium]